MIRTTSRRTWVALLLAGSFSMLHWGEPQAAAGGIPGQELLQTVPGPKVSPIPAQPLAKEKSTPLASPVGATSTRGGPVHLRVADARGVNRIERPSRIEAPK
jgi:hypothetical protein